jgi:hypothetical protein
VETKIIGIMVVVIFLGSAIYLKLCTLLDGIRDLTSLMRDMNKHIIGDADGYPDPLKDNSLKRLIADRCLGIENELVRIRYGVFGGERSPSIDKINILDTLVDIKATISKESK